jgi:LmbE family N-acetylglucosaminyl deacetylase
MQFSPMAIVRPVNRDRPKPYSHNFTHSYNSDIDSTKYREFYAPGRMLANIRVNHERTLYHPGDHVVVRAAVKGPERREGPTLSMSAKIKDSSGRELDATPESHQMTHFSGGEINFPTWIVPSTQSPGLYSISFSASYAAGTPPADTATTEIAVNNLPASLLVFAPHEDDEHSYAGLIRAAVEAGIPVKAVILTGGDVGACERYYQKACGPNEAREFGMVRMEESAEALEHIGMTRDRLAFLGLPDGGSGAIWSEHIKVSSPFMSIYLATDHAPYENILKANLPYARDAVIEVIKQIIADFRPALIATPHPDERHVDHRTTNWFVIKACQELLRDKRIDPQTIVLADQAYGAGGFKPAPYRYEKWPVYLSGEAAALKQEMGWIYQSQDGNLSEGMRQTLAELPREEIHYRIVDWQEHAGWNE